MGFLWFGKSRDQKDGEKKKSPANRDVVPNFSFGLPFNHTLSSYSKATLCRCGTFDENKLGDLDGAMGRYPRSMPSLVLGEIKHLAVPFSDVVVTGYRDDNGAMSRSIVDRLRSSYKQWVDRFQVICVSPNYSNRRRYFFGDAVFAPQREDRRVGRLEFAWSRPSEEDADRVSGDDREPADRFEPVFGPFQRGVEAGQVAPSWYTGQVALAVSFNPDIAPATLEHPGTYQGPFPLDQTVLVFGRAAGIRATDIDAICVGTNDLGESYIDADASAKLDVKVMNGRDRLSRPWWRVPNQWLTLSLGYDRGLNLMMRWVPFDGHAPFVPLSAPLSERGFVVEGIILPDLSQWRQWADDTLEVRVELDAEGVFRSQEPAELAYTLIGCSLRNGEFFDLFDHEGLKFNTRRENLTVTSVRLTAAGQTYRIVEHQSLMGTETGSRKRDASPFFAKLGNNPKRLDFDSEDPVGWIPLPLDGSPIRVTMDYVGTSSTDEKLMSLGWLDRVCKVDIRGDVLGLASFVLNDFKIWIGSDFIEITSPSGQKKTIELIDEELYELGPLLVRYVDTPID